MSHHSQQRGFTLLEFSMVMILFGVLVGSVLRGQELITSAKVRNMLDQKSAVQSALIAFSDRHQVNAGDLTPAQALLIDSDMVASGSGGNGLTTLGLSGGNNESATAFQNLTIGRYLSCRACLGVTAALPNPLSDNTNSPANVIGNYISYGYSNSSSGGTTVWWDAVATANRNIITTGSGVSTQMLREMDLKADDGSPGSGNFRLSSVGTTSFSLASCVVGAGAASTWLTSDSINCAGAWLTP
jgi:prepilin-type N-terminal cleavage/methylation domain-containing protein